MKKKLFFLLFLMTITNLITVNFASAREHILIAGSSTVFPFSSKVAEVFGKKSSFKTPVVEAIGSTSGIKAFCQGTGLHTPDIANTSRKMESAEKKICNKNGVKGIVEVKVGYDGIIVAQSKKAQSYNLTLKQLFMALAAKVPTKQGKLIANPYQTWKQIDPSFPDDKIKIYGPPPTSGTRDAFENLVMKEGAKSFKSLKALSESDKKAFKKVYKIIREDGVFVESGENDNLIIQKLSNNSTNVGILGFSYLEANSGVIRGKLINNIEPTFENILEGQYPIARPIFFYVKKQHVGVIKGIHEFIKEFTSERTWGDDGYLTEIGFIPLANKDRKIASAVARGLKTIDE